MVEQFWEKIKLFSVRFTQVHKRNKVRRYLLPIVLVGGVLLLKYFLVQYVSDQTSYHLLTLIVIVSAWYGGLGPGLLATLLTAILDTLFFVPPDTTNLYSYIFFSAGIFTIGGVFISLISEAIRQTDAQKSEFIGIVSHELKNPLSAIAIYAEILSKRMKKKSDTSYVRYISNINQQVTAITVMINDLLDLTKLESGKLIYHYEKFSIDSLLKEVILEQQLLSTTHKLSLLGKTAAVINGDKQKIKQVLINLITNAIKYSPKVKKVQIYLKTKGTTIEILIRDYGLGIQSDQIENIFKRFYRTHDAEKSKAQGLGLGLHIARQIVKRHKGKLYATSTFGKGSTFHLILPIVSN